MISAPSSTWFSGPPHWGWLIVLYFFVGGLAGGSYFLAALIDLLGRPEDRPLARVGYYIAFPCIVFSGLLLSLDLTRPLRFWHMLIESHTFRPMFKYWSPMSIGSWALLVFGLFSFISFLGALAEEGRIAWSPLRTVRPPGVVATIVSVVGGISGFYVASYTGVLLAVTNRPIWSDTHLLGMLFVISAASTSAALLMLLARRYGLALPALSGLRRLDDWMLMLELLVLIALVVSLGPAARGWLNAWGAFFAIVVVFGVLVPLILAFRARQRRELHVAAASVLVLLGGFLLRLVIVFSANSVRT
jgi:formate-dependent nitrite reductase membrane component NrfD